MISYSTGDSGTGSDVDKVREATRIAKEKRPDLVIDGPLQYDAAVMPNVARSKARTARLPVRRLCLYSRISTRVTPLIRRFNEAPI